jgi:hypothetical protein
MVRAPFIRLVDATAGTDREALAAALRSAIDASSPALDLPARNELEAVLQGL